MFAYGRPLLQWVDRVRSGHITKQDRCVIDKGEVALGVSFRSRVRFDRGFGFGERVAVSIRFMLRLMRRVMLRVVLRVVLRVRI